MTLKEKIDVKQIVRNTHMCDRPGYYSGRGAITDDLNDKILEGIYEKIQEYHGKEAAQQYAQMVADIPKLTATDFLLTLYRLEGNKWVWNKNLIGEENGLYPEDEASAFGTLASVLYGLGEVDHTDYIRKQFLKRHDKSSAKIIYLDPFMHLYKL